METVQEVDAGVHVGRFLAIDTQGDSLLGPEGHIDRVVVLLDVPGDLMSRIIRAPSEKFQDKLAESMGEWLTSVRGELGSEVSREEVKEAYRNYDFSGVSHRILNFCTVDLSSLYLDVSKDRLYCDHPEDPARRATQTVLMHLAECLATLLAPVLSFTAEEFWLQLPGEREDSVHLALFREPAEIVDEPELDAAFDRLLALRETVFAGLEELRQEGAIGKSEEAQVVFGGNAAALHEDLETTGVSLAHFLIVSAVDESEPENPATDVTGYPGLRVGVAPYDAHTCSRCWRRVEDPVEDPDLPDLCTRCHGVVRRLLEEGRAELRETDV